MAEDPEFLARMLQHVIETGSTDPGGVRASIDGLLQAYAKDGLWEEAEQGLSLLRAAGLIAQDCHDRMVRELQGGRQSRDAFVNRYRGG